VAEDRHPRVAIAHDWLVRYAGSERVVEQLLAAFPRSRLLTTIVEPERLPLALSEAEPSFLDSLPGSHGRHEWFLPLMPLAWRLREPVDDVDAVVVSTHACANAVRTRAGIPLVSYCHTPMRYAWDFDAERERFPRPLQAPARMSMAWFRRWDRAVAARVTRFVANSSAVADRIARFYGREATIVHPPVRTEYFTPGGAPGERFLYVGRLTGYKRPDLVVQAFAGLPYELDVVGEGPLSERLRQIATPNVRFCENIGDAELRRLYRSARALVYPVDEDFGIAMAEAQACGTPVLGLAAGGALDIVEPGVTGWLLERQDVGELRDAIRRGAVDELSRAEIRARAERFSEARFRREIVAVVQATVGERS
jgi:glycosyltransferase involved in cell wall biosynthesis